jgi:hypothetical protein
LRPTEWSFETIVDGKSMSGMSALVTEGMQWLESEENHYENIIEKVSQMLSHTTNYWVLLKQIMQYYDWDVSSVPENVEEILRSLYKKIEKVHPFKSPSASEILAVNASEEWCDMIQNK